MGGRYDVELLHRDSNPDAHYLANTRPGYMRSKTVQIGSPPEKGNVLGQQAGVSYDVSLPIFSRSQIFYATAHDRPIRPTFQEAPSSIHQLVRSFLDVA